MNTSNIKSYAPKARTDFIAAMSKQAAKYGISESDIAPLEIKGDLALINGQPFPATIANARNALVEKVQQLGFIQVMEQAAYSWFNRLCAIRFMELKGYLDHGRRVLSSADGSAGTPQILDDCLDIELPGLNKAKVHELKLDGTQDEALYRELLLAQCHALHEAMPFLFEALDDDSELLLPENLTKTDSLIRELVEAIPEQDWQEVEVIGWLYQFYISEKKDQVIGKVVKSEDIPAATQLFTPNWIVKYLVQNSVGRQWLQTYPGSPLKGQMDYYIEPAEQSDEVNRQLAELTPSSIEPKEIKVLDPACGSGHILVEAYKVLKTIYEERGYRSRDIPQLILEHNLFGLDIDDRAAQLAGFALMMLAREDDRRIFTRTNAEGERLRLNVLAIQESQHIDLANNWRDAELPEDESYQMMQDIWQRFEQGKTFGSLIEVPFSYVDQLQSMLDQLTKLSEQGSMLQQPAAEALLPLVQQAWVLAQRYDSVVANPPYMGSKGMNAEVKKYLKDNFKGYEKDIFSAFIIRNLQLANTHGQLGFMTPFVWMFISSYEQLRDKLIGDEIISTLIQLEYSGFDGATVPICTFTLTKGHIANYKGCYIRLSDFRGAKNQAPKTLEAIKDRHCGWFYEAAPDDFKKIPGSPIAYWVSRKVGNAFLDSNPIKDCFPVNPGIRTGKDEQFLRLWFEVSQLNTQYHLNDSEQMDLTIKWFPLHKGGNFRKWYGNAEHVIDLWNGGENIKTKSPDYRLRDAKWYFRPFVSWSRISSSSIAFRYFSKGVLFSDAGPGIFAENSCVNILSLLNSKLGNFFLKIINPTLNYQKQDIEVVPFIRKDQGVDIEKAVDIARMDWDSSETSWDFKSLPLIEGHADDFVFLEKSYEAWVEGNSGLIVEMKNLEEKNNRLFIDAFSLQDELRPDVPIEQITLTVNPAYRYGGKLTEEEQWTRFREDTMEELVSYSIGCMMGRYSLDKPGLIYAHSSNEGFDASQYTTFPADDDGIVPITDKEWFADDAANRVEEFIGVAWDKASLEENLNFLADNLGPKKNEGSRDTIRRYLSDKFFKDHLQTYKKRPIYWLFSSGKEKAFQCLVYLHRYNEGTLARMRTEYVIPLTAKLTAHVEKLEQDKDASGSTAETKKLEKEIAKLHKQQAELSTFDEKLRHYADQRISLDLDDGVKVNYGKFGDLLAEVKAVTGKKPEAK